MSRKIGVEFLGTFWLVLAGCGSAVISAKFPEVGIGLLGVSLAFGLTLVTMIYAYGHVSGGHFNPAVTLGIYAAGRMDSTEVVPYILAQVAGGVFAALMLWFIMQGDPTFDIAKGFAQNGYDSASPGGYDLESAFLTEMLFTFMFLMVILGATSRRGAGNMAPLAIGAMLALIHLVTIPVTNTSVNPARSTGPALFAGVLAIEQLWLFWVAPILGAIFAGLANRFTSDHD